MKHPQLNAEKRTVLGKKVKQLRREGFLPANVYGKGLNSTSIQVKMADFEKIYKEVGDTGLIGLSFDGKTKPVLVKSIQMNFQNHTPLHVDFFQVNLKEKVKAVVPLVIVGEAEAVVNKVGEMIQAQSDVEVEALPDKLPESIEVNVESLAELGAQITVGDVTVPEEVTILTDPTQTIVKIAEIKAPEPEPEAAEGEEGAEGAAAEGDGGESGSEEKPAEGTADNAEEKSE